MDWRIWAIIGLIVGTFALGAVVTAFDRLTAARFKKERIRRLKQGQKEDDEEKR